MHIMYEMSKPVIWQKYKRKYFRMLSADFFAHHAKC